MFAFTSSFFSASATLHADMCHLIASTCSTVNCIQRVAKYAEDADGDVERFEMTRMYGDKMFRLDFANPTVSHHLGDATKYDDDYLDELFRKMNQ